jgi:hypothetical protein
MVLSTVLVSYYYTIFFINSCKNATSSKYDVLKCRRCHCAHFESRQFGANVLCFDSCRIVEILPNSLNQPQNIRTKIISTRLQPIVYRA